jgi:hypothetical protein
MDIPNERKDPLLKHRRIGHVDPETDSLSSHVDGFVGPVFYEVAVFHVHGHDVVSHDADRREESDGLDFLDAVVAVVPTQTGDDFLMNRLDQLLIALPFHHQEHGEVAVDLGDVAFDDALGEDGAHFGFATDVVEQTLIGDAELELDRVELADGILGGAGGAEIDLRVVTEDAVLFHSLAFPGDRTHIDSGFLPDRIVAVPRVAHERAQNQLFLVIERVGHGVVCTSGRVSARRIFSQGGPG